MALIDCHECGKSISSKAKTCPQCGAKRKSHVGRLLLAYVILSIILGSGAKTMISIEKAEKDKLETARVAALTPEQRAAEMKQRASEQKAQAEAGKETTAVYVCRDFIKKTLKDPDSVEFIGMSSETPVTKEKDGLYKVGVAARAKNSFGATVPSVFLCRARYVGGDNWTLVSMKEAPM